MPPNGRPKIVPAQDDPTGRKGPSYPYYSWPQCVKFGDAIRQLGGDRTAVATSDLAHYLEVADDSSMLSANLASARTYGMIEGRGSFTLTEAGKRFFYPTSDGEKRQAELEMLYAPPAHRLLIDRYDGGLLPPMKQIANVLMREVGVPKSWAERTASLFMDSCSKLAVVDGSGHLRYAVAVRSRVRIAHADDSENDEHDEPQASPVQPAQPVTQGDGVSRFGIRAHAHGTTASTTTTQAQQPQMTTTSTTTTAWSTPIPNGQMIRLETPEPLPRAAWEKLVRYVQALEPLKDGEP